MTHVPFGPIWIDPRYAGHHCPCGCDRYGKMWTTTTSTGSTTRVFDSWREAVTYALTVPSFKPKVHRQPFGTKWVVTLRKPYIYTATFNGATA